jgi:hypothetical protein
LKVRHRMTMVRHRTPTWARGVCVVRETVQRRGRRLHSGRDSFILSATVQGPSKLPLAVLRVYHPISISATGHEAVSLCLATNRLPSFHPLTNSLWSSQHESGPRLARYMSQSSPETTSTSNFQAIFNNALKDYERQTKNDLNAHPLAAQLQSCDSPSVFLALLQGQVHQFDQFRSGDERLTKWLNPIVNVLYAFSATLGEGVGLVSLGLTNHTCSDIHLSGILLCQK